MKNLLYLLILLSPLSAFPQYWQQAVYYKMDIDLDHTKHQYTGKAEIEYTNNSPDSLNEVYFHLYYNAFQPGSMMDHRSRNVVDPDKRIGERIKHLSDEEIGYHQIQSFTQDQNKCEWEVFETVMKVKLAQAIPPGRKTTFEMDWKSQIPIQIRRTGRNNKEGIDYSMSQWYPKLAEYDQDGWHAIQYIGREYHGVWGDFDVSISIDSSYTIGATGILQNINQVGHGYGPRTIQAESDRITWNFHAENVIDFVWAADPDYIHTIHQSKDGVDFHFFYQNDSNIIERWEKLPAYAIKCFDLMKEFVGPYPYPQYSVIQGGDGGMEYPMATLILGTGSQNGLIGVTVHEAIHSWFQAILATNEGKYPWMDEGFNTYYNHLVIDSLFGRKSEFPHKGSYNSYFKLIEKDLFEPIATHSDHYGTNRAYGTAAYSMGCIFLNQLQYIVGEEDFDAIMKTYWKEWKFKHPGPGDFQKIAESVSGMELDWYFNYFIETTKTIDYALVDVKSKKGSTDIQIERVGEFPMPLDVSVELKSGDKKTYTIPLTMMMSAKKKDGSRDLVISEYAQWSNPNYTLNVPFKEKDIASIEIDPSQRMADTDRSNNRYPVD